MNEVLDCLDQHRSIRHYTEQPVTDEQLSKIVEAAQRAPNWINAQLVSILVIRDQEKRKLMSKLCDNQPHVAQAPVFLIFCADYYRIWLAMNKNSKSLEKTLENVNTVMVGAHEAGIAAATAVVAAASLGLGSVIIGAARAHPFEMIEALKLPRYVFPVVGLCIGHPADNPGLKPRLPKKAICFSENYNADLECMIQTYDKEYAYYLAHRGSNQKTGSWTKWVSDFYSDHSLYPNTLRMLKHQGFLGGEK